MPIRTSVRDQSVLQKRAAAGAILRLIGAWGAEANQQAKASFGPKMPSLRVYAVVFLAINIDFKLTDNYT